MVVLFYYIIFNIGKNITEKTPENNFVTIPKPPQVSVNNA